jgi:DNA-binding FrmR family transcriptional regulator
VPENYVTGRTAVELDSQELTAITLRLKRAQGHLGSVIRMMEEGAECEAVLTQLAAVNKALSRGAFAVVATGLQKCIAEGGESDGVDLAKMEKLFLALA